MNLFGRPSSSLCPMNNNDLTRTGDYAPRVLAVLLLLLVVVALALLSGVVHRGSDCGWSIGESSPADQAQVVCVR